MKNDLLFDEIKQLQTANEQSQFKFFYGKYSKNIFIAYLLLIFFGIFGIHKFYLNKASAWLYFIFSWTIIIPLVLIFFDLFLLPMQVRKHNQYLAIDLVELIKIHKDTNTSLIRIEKQVERKRTTALHYTFVAIVIIGILIPIASYSALMLSHYKIEMRLKKMNPDGSSYDSILNI